MNLRQCEIFRAVMTTSSITEAADRLGITQPAVSKMLAQIERDLGFPLFLRERRRLVPTPEAQALFKEVERAFLGLEHLTRFARDLKERYGERVMEQIASGDDRALASDFPEEGPRRAIARALVAAAESHESLGLSRRQAELARERLLSSEHQHERAQHELRRKDFDLDL